MRKSSLWQGVVLALGILAASAALAVSNAPGGAQKPSTKASGGSLTQPSGTVDACGGVQGSVRVIVTGTTDDGGGADNVFLTIWDDGSQVHSVPLSVPVGTTLNQVVTYAYQGTVGSAATGIGLYLVETPGSTGSSLASIDPFVPTPISTCAAAADIPVNAPWSLAGLAALIGAAAVWMRRRRLI